MDNKKIVEFSLESLKKAGADKSECILTESAKRELNADAGEISLCRTTFDTAVRLTAIKDKRRGYVSINGKSEREIEAAAHRAVETALASAPDEAYDISEKQEPEIFDNGVAEPDMDRMLERLEVFLSQSKERYPKIIVRMAVTDFERSEEYYMNSNGADFVSRKGIYQAVVMFSAKDGEKTSSFNYSGFSSKNMDREILESGSLDVLFEQLSGQIETRNLEGKFTGDIIVTPDCLPDFTGFITDLALRDASLISGTSVYAGKLEKQVAAKEFTLHSKPVSDEIADGYFVTPDGYKAENAAIIDKGTLKTFLPSLYGARKTGLKRVSNAGECCVVEPGGEKLDEIVKSVKKGLLVARFSGGRPNENGDFSGIAKNSYYIEDGKILYPVSETMISGNIPEMFMNIKGISVERVDFGNAVFPWVSFGGLTVSGK